jgi:hypothetical protein
MGLMSVIIYGDVTQAVYPFSIDKLKIYTLESGYVF